MKILLISSVALTTPPMLNGHPSYGGLERVVYDIAWGLKDSGHDVTIIASKGSKAPPGVDLFETVTAWNELSKEEQQAYGKADGVQREWNKITWLAHTWNGWRAHEESAYALYKDAVKGFDVVVDNSWCKWAYSDPKEEIIGVCHSVKSYNVKAPRPYMNLVGVSNGHARFLTRELHIPVRVLWNPVNVNDYELVKNKGERILSFNRIMPQKGIHHFLNLCNVSHIMGDVAGDDSTLVQDQEYVNMVKRQCQASAYLKYYGLVDEVTRKKLLSEARCLVCFKDAGYEEVFGLSAVEALACGTPVIAAHSWGFDDIIIHGKTGFLVDKLEDVPKYVEKLKEINPEDCRARAKVFSRFNRSVDYAKMLESMKRGSRW